MTNLDAAVDQIAKALEPSYVRPAVPVATNIEKNAQQISDEANRQNEELEIESLIHRAWVQRMALNRGFAFMIGPEDVKALQYAQAAIRSVPERDRQK